jgi:quinol monooxygenase YgiN
MTNNATEPTKPDGPEVAIVVRYQAMAGKGDEVAALLARHTAATRAEPGNLDFVALRGTEDPDSFVLYERYESTDAFKAHQASPHFKGIAVAQIRPLLAERTLEFCQVVEPDGSLWMRSTRLPS